MTAPVGNRTAAVITTTGNIAAQADDINRNLNELAVTAAVDTVQDGFDTLNAKMIAARNSGGAAPAAGGNLLSKVGDSVGGAALLYAAYRLPQSAEEIWNGGVALFDPSMDTHTRMQTISVGADAVSMNFSSAVTGKLLWDKKGPAYDAVRTLSRKTADCAGRAVSAGRNLVGAAPVAEKTTEVVAATVARETTRRAAAGTGAALARTVGSSLAKKAVPVLSAGFAVADVVSAVAVANDPKATKTEKVTAGVAAFGSTLSAAGTMMMVGGGAASLTGVGAIAGVPLATIGAGLAIAGAALNVGANVYAWWKSK